MIGERLDHPLQLDRERERTPVEFEAPLPGIACKVRPRGRAGLILAAVVAMALLCLAYVRVSHTFDVNSDNASIVLQAESFAHGNYLLRGWHLSTVPFLLELPFYALGILLLGGIRPILMHVVPAIFTTITVALAVWLTGRGSARRFAGHGRFVTFLLIGLPTSLLASHCLRGPGHLFTVLLLLAALLLIDTPAPALAKPTRPILLTFLLGLALYSDRLSLVVFLLPLVLVCLARLFHQGRRESAVELRLLGASAAAFALSNAVPALIARAGGYQIWGVGFRLIALPRLWDNVHLTLQAILGLSGANFADEPLGPGTLLPLLHLAGLSLALFSLGRVLLTWRARTDGATLVPQILATGMVINLAAYVASDLPVGLHSIARALDIDHYLLGLGIDATRYLLPFTFFGAILAGRVGIEWILQRIHGIEGSLSLSDDRRRRGTDPRSIAVAPTPRTSRRGAWRFATLALVLLTMGYVGSFAQRLCSPIQTPSRWELCEWLRGRGLRYGYASFWNANIVTLLSQGQTKVRTVEGVRTGIRPHMWLTQDDWYRGTPANFMVIDRLGIDHVTAKRAVHGFGQPSQAQILGDFLVLIWDKDLTPLLGRAN